jgi:hypothetical protein
MMSSPAGISVPPAVTGSVVIRRLACAGLS